MDVYSPGEASTARRSAVVVIHGGAWMGGNRKDMAALSRLIAEEGMVAASVSYRLAPKSRWPAMIDDVQTAVRYLRQNALKFGIAPQKIGATGASAGGHLALLLGFTDTRDPRPKEYSGQSSRVAAVLNLFGPTDLRRDYGPQFDAVFQIVTGKRRSEAGTEIRQASPVAWIDARSAPVFTIQGTTDLLVPAAQAKWLDESLRKAGVPSELRVIEGMGHEIDTKRPEAVRALRDGVRFLRERLAAAEAVRNPVGSV